MNNKRNTTIVLSLLLFGFLSSCSLEKATDLFEDKGCVYKGLLEIHREPMTDWSLVSYRLSEGEEGKSDLPLDVVRWEAKEKTKEVLIGRHFGLYYPNYLVLSPESTKLSLTGDLVSKRPLMFAGKSTVVKYDERSILELPYKDHSVAVSLVITNSSQRQLSQVQLKNSNGYRGYDVLTDTPTDKGMFSFTKDPVTISSMGYKEYAGYLFGMELPATVQLHFWDDNGSEYLIEVVDAYKQNPKNPKSFEAVVDLDEDALIAIGAKRTITSIEIDGKDIVFPAGGGTMEVEVKVVKRSRTYVRGQLIETSETPVTDYTYSVKGSEEIQVEKIGSSKFRISGSANTGEQSRHAELHITADGVTRQLKITQPAQGFEITGEIE